MRKIVVFATGFGGRVDEPDVAELRGVCNDKGYNMRAVPIDWKGTQDTDWESQVLATACGIPSEQLVLAGFSYGAVAAVRAARTRRRVAGLWLFSLSPRFAGDEDVPMRPDSLVQCAASLEEPFENIAAGIEADDVRVFAGTHDSNRPSVMMSRAYRAAEAFPGGHLHIVPYARHDIADPPYLAAIAEHIPQAEVAQTTVQPV